MKLIDIDWLQILMKHRYETTKQYSDWNDLVDEKWMVGELVLSFAAQIQIRQARFHHEKISTFDNITLGRSHCQPVASGRKLVSASVTESWGRFCCVAEGSVKAWSEFDGVGQHWHSATKIVFIQYFFDGTNTTVHHIGWSHNVGT